MRCLELDRVPLTGELLGISLAGCILELPQLPQKGFALSSEIARLHFQVPCGCRHDDGQDQQEPAPGQSRPTAWESDCREYKVRTSEQAPDENRAEDETSGQDGQGRDPIDGGFGVHDPALGETPCGQP